MPLSTETRLSTHLKPRRGKRSSNRAGRRISRECPRWSRSTGYTSEKVQFPEFGISRRGEPVQKPGVRPAGPSAHRLPGITFHDFHIHRAKREFALAAFPCLKKRRGQITHLRKRAKRSRKIFHRKGKGLEARVPEASRATVCRPGIKCCQHVESGPETEFRDVESIPEALWQLTSRKKDLPGFCKAAVPRKV